MSDVATVTYAPGTILPFEAHRIPPWGWLRCDGRLVEVRAYLELYKAIGSAFCKPSDPTNLFRLPEFATRHVIRTGEDIPITWVWATL